MSDAPRPGLRVLVVDNDRPANSVSHGVGGLLGHDRVKPADLRDSGRRQLAEHANVELRHGAVEDAERDRDVFVVRPADGPPVHAHAVVLAHGLRYDPPALPGIEAFWGRSVFHCAFCDGWEVRDRPLAFHGSGPGAVRSALVLVVTQSCIGERRIHVGAAIAREPWRLRPAQYGGRANGSSFEG